MPWGLHATNKMVVSAVALEAYIATWFLGGNFFKDFQPFFNLFLC